jgi:hypothetical protein
MFSGGGMTRRAWEVQAEPASRVGLIQALDGRTSRKLPPYYPRIT